MAKQALWIGQADGLAGPVAYRLEAGQPLPHLATENKALQDMHKQLAGWISDIRERKSGAEDLASPPSASPSPGEPLAHKG